MGLIFYTTSHCHLCELAERVMMTTPLPTAVEVEAVDIAESAALIERYGERIPVLQRSDSGAELDWPFDATSLQQFLTTV